MKAATSSTDRIPRDKRGSIDMRLLATWATVCALLDLGPTAAHNLKKRDPLFPKPVPLPGVRERYSIEELQAYVRQRIALRDEQATA